MDNTVPARQSASTNHHHQDAPRAWVFAGGEFSTGHLPACGLEHGDQVICVDRGLEHCLAAGLEPTLLVGDFDSVDKQVLDRGSLSHIPRQVYPPAKAASDLELALQLLAEESFSEVSILGVSGGRTDHMLFNWSLPALRHWPFRLILLDGTTCSHVLQGSDECSLDVQPAQTLSLLAKSEATGVTTSGLRYALDDATLEVGSTLGLSNVVDGTTVKVSITSGTLLVMINREEVSVTDR